jgi:tetratricopeptide (TPR) repeat protein
MRHAIQATCIDGTIRAVTRHDFFENYAEGALTAMPSMGQIGPHLSRLGSMLYTYPGMSEKKELTRTLADRRESVSEKRFRPFFAWGAFLAEQESHWFKGLGPKRPHQLLRRCSMRSHKSGLNYRRQAALNVHTHLIFVSFLLCTLIFQSGTISASTACDDAKEHYATGTKLLNFQERKDSFAKAVELCPEYAEAHVNLADAYENLGDFDAAERHYAQAVALGLQSPIPYIGLGEVYLRTGRYGLAEDCYAKGCEIEPANERLLAGQKIVEERMKREKSFFTRAQIRTCLSEDDQFRLMCMCPADDHSFLRRWICMPVLLFSPGSTDLSKEARQQLDEVGEAVKNKDLSGIRWLVIGHADNVGEKSRNLQISKKRAERVKRYLVDRHGLDSNRLRTLCFGEDKPRCPNATAEKRSENRRVEIVLEN